MDNTEIKKKILSFLKNNQLTVVSTIDTKGEKTESAVVAFAENENLEIIFGTSNTTRKYKNLQNNKNVSFVIGWDGTIGTVQYEGVAEEIKKENMEQYASILVTKNPFSAKFMDREDQRYFVVRPRWIRLLDMSKKPDETFEIDF